MLAQPEADTRLAAAEILAGRVDSAWLATVRQLTEDSDPSVRAAAARLLAPHEPEVARTVLQALGSEENAAVRELASKGLSEVMPDDFPSLRALMRNGDAVPRVRAARRVLAITR
jgi:HEAT repeat protein